ncbi:ABC transporter ATP-binding protein [Haloquadratum walsbyi]|uniref:ABC-type transport system ATP-binding protein (Probable substrate branched-chain amino acids) n=1 Tax=Haloquadratum walsbyi (strain DSM 16854 / JCM 12705 / C23) TaxID=768065 RepID=G0LJG5_HALWC|nr:ABC transporter ATP-binding protein [Haloquadratum walsbyi]CCC40899.1 ABC-type transport system ATP-binding protein (probable substrate branched-chain amino acids) [Haloquadratum walsbyi C23]
MSDSSLETIPTIDDALFSARDIETGYGELQVLYGVDIDIRQNEIVLVFGPNGAGKSTLIKALYQRLPLWGGEVEIDGSDLSDVNSNQMIEHGIGFVPQTENVFPNLTVAENLDIGAIHVTNPESRRAALLELFPRLKERLMQTAETLSGGERQMLAMARALMPNPDLLFIDEPSAGLSPQLIERTFDHIAQIRESGTAVLMIEQDVNAALSVADRGYVLEMGENRFEGDAMSIRESQQIRDLYLGR